MSLQPEPIGPVPEATARVAQAAFPKGNVYLQMLRLPHCLRGGVDQRNRPGAWPS